jgi:hypothetical protein
MSWNFGVKTQGGERDAERVFNNAVYDATVGNNGAAMDFATQAKVRSMVKSAIYNAPKVAGRDQGIRIDTSGHVDPVTGFGTLRVSVEFYPVAEEVPNVPPELQPGPPVEGDAQDAAEPRVLTPGEVAALEATPEPATSPAAAEAAVIEDHEREAADPHVGANAKNDIDSH